MPSEDRSPLRKVWILMFDRLPPAAGVNSTSLSSAFDTQESEDPVDRAFDDLDLNSSFFEQYMLQQVGDAATVTDMLGGATAVGRLTAQRLAANRSASLVQLSCGGDDSSSASLVHFAELLLSSDERSASFIRRTIRVSGEAWDANFLPGDSQLCEAFSADLVWIHVQISTADQGEAAAGKFLQLIQRLRQDIAPTALSRPVLIVSAIRGSARPIGSPFTEGLREGLIHVPLWIDHGAGHACRIQSPAGSFDLLPTLADYLMGAAPGVVPECEQGLENNSTVEERPTSGSVQLSGREMSLVNVCEHHRLLPDRLLRLRGDSWRALRTQQYLLVLLNSPGEPSEAAGQAPDAESLTVRRLYLKPDDLWNVNDAVVSYAAIADQMEDAAREFERNRN